MRRYYTGLIEDFKDRQNDWQSIRNFHGVFCTKLERREIKWRDVDQIAKLKSTHLKPTVTVAELSHNVPAINVSVPPPPIQLKASVTDATKQLVPTVACPLYQRGACTFDGYHNGLHHICAYCLRERAKFHKHPEYSCYTLVGVPTKKNDASNVNGRL